MGFLSKLFGEKLQPISFEERAFIAAVIATEFERIRQQWCDMCLKLLEAAETPIIHSKLGGEAELAMKAYQLWLTCYFIADHSYIPEELQKTFTDGLFGLVCETQDGIDEIIPYVERYDDKRPRESSRNETEHFLEVATDLAVHFTGKKESNFEAMILISTIPNASALIYRTVAMAFGDERIVKKVERLLASGAFKFAGMRQMPRP